MPPAKSQSAKGPKTAPKAATAMKQSEKPAKKDVPKPKQTKPGKSNTPKQNTKSPQLSKSGKPLKCMRSVGNLPSNAQNTTSPEPRAPQDEMDNFADELAATGSDNALDPSMQQIL